MHRVKHRPQEIEQREQVIARVEVGAAIEINRGTTTRNDFDRIKRLKRAEEAKEGIDHRFREVFWAKIKQGRSRASEEDG